jgi:hypothetical protein
MSPAGGIRKQRPQNNNGRVTVRTGGHKREAGLDEAVTEACRSPRSVSNKFPKRYFTWHTLRLTPVSPCEARGSTYVGKLFTWSVEALVGRIRARNKHLLCKDCLTNLNTEKGSIEQGS